MAKVGRISKKRQLVEIVSAAVFIFSVAAGIYLSARTYLLQQADIQLWSNHDVLSKILAILAVTAITILALFLVGYRMRRSVTQKTHKLREELAARRKAEQELHLRTQLLEEESAAHQKSQNVLRYAMEHAEASSRALRLLSASNRTLLRSTSEEEQLNEVCRIAVEIGGYTTAWVGFALHDDEKSIAPVAWFGIEEDQLTRFRMSWQEGEQGASAMATAIRTGTMQIRQDILHDPSLAPWHDYARKRNHQSAIALPLRIDDEVIGGLAIYASEPYAFQQAEIELLEELAADLAFGIQTIRMRDTHEKTLAHVNRLAYYDSLTGLPNQFLFMEQLEQHVASAAHGQPLSLLLLDLNHLREINDAHGHVLGDQILVRVAQQLQQLCSPNCFLARFGGDFAIICPGSDQEASKTLGGTIVAALSVPHHLSGQHLAISANIGMAIFPRDGESSSELLSKADLATSRARTAGGGFCFYRPEMGEQLARTLKLANRLASAMRENLLQLFYQPKVDLVSGRLVGAEALLRWQDPHLGWISPLEFVAIAESRGMMIELGTWVLRTACRQIRQWQDEGCPPSGRIAVNISACQLEDANFAAELTAILEESGVSPGCLELELTESILMTDPERAVTILGDLKKRGFSLAIDDFGTGYSSLAYLKRFPVDTLKIDRAFVREMLENRNDRAIVATIMAMAQQLGLTTVAEGIEEEGQQRVLLELGCMHGQGYHFGHPKPAELFKEKWL